ncbi:MAG: hybrid sensor histidine kinase/response regulator [Pseudanabaena sp. ELA607]
MHKSPLILVVDDEPVNFSVIRTLLLKDGYQLEYISNGIDIMQKLSEINPDLLLLDVMMPEISGMDICRQIKSDPAWEGLPIIIVTALSTKEDLSDSLDAGADDFIPKPVHGLELRARVKSMLRIKRQYDKIQELYESQSGVIKLLENNLMELKGNVARAIPHEINTPLNGILGTISLLLQYSEGMSAEETKELLSMAYHSALRLEDITQTFLTYVKVFLKSTYQSNHNTSTHIAIPLHEVVVNVAKVQAERFSRLADLVCHPMEYACIKIENIDLEYILKEIISNAFKFSNQRDIVTIFNKVENNYVYVMICNKGLSMTEEEIAKVGAFMQFRREIHEQQGLGLGLTIARKIIEIYHGSSKLYNSDKGMTVEMCFPIEAEIV